MSVPKGKEEVHTRIYAVLVEGSGSMRSPFFCTGHPRDWTDTLTALAPSLVEKKYKYRERNFSDIKI